LCLTHFVGQEDATQLHYLRRTKSYQLELTILLDFGVCCLLDVKGMTQMNKKFLLAYILFFISINTMAALASVDCKTAANGISARNLEEHQLQCNTSNKVTENETELMDKTRDDNFTNLQFSSREQSTSGSLTFILLIPALLVFVFSGFEKSNK
jgi:hypothetical protein